MKKQLLYSLALLLTPLFIIAHNGDMRGKYTKEKTIKKEYNVNTDATIEIDNSYGNLDIVTWDENRIVIDVTITTNGDDEHKVQEKLDGITVDFDATPNWVSARTQFERNRGKSWWSWTKKNSVNMKINYLIKMPATNNVKLNNDYGSINLGTLKGNADIRCDYGKITTKELLGDSNEIRFDYTNNCYFEYIESGLINADYSDYTVSKTKDLRVQADYTKSHIEIAENVNYNCDYGSIKVDKANTFKGNGSYLTVRLGDMYQNVSIGADYGSVRIDKLHDKVKSVNINSDYTGIKIGYSPSLDFSFNLDLEYAGLKGEDDFEILKKRTDYTSKSYSGYHGSENANCNITIDSEYGGITFFKN